MSESQTVFPFQKKLNRNKAISEACKGHKVSIETRHKISLAKCNERNASWKGANAGYTAVHMWIARHIGRKDYCEHCGKTRQQSSHLELANISGLWKREQSDWLTLCRPCHRKYDNLKRITACPHGHEYTFENIYINCRGHRGCKICRVASQKKYKEKKQCLT